MATVLRRKGRGLRSTSPDTAAAALKTFCFFNANQVAVTVPLNGNLRGGGFSGTSGFSDTATAALKNFCSFLTGAARLG